MENITRSPQLVSVQEELDDTMKKLEQYTDLIAKLCDELDSLRSTIASCETCNKKIAKSTAARHRSRSPVPLWRRVLGSPGRKGHSQVANPDKSLQVPPIAEASLIYPSSEQPVLPVNFAAPKPLPLVLPTAVAPLTHASSSTVPSDYTPTTLPPVENIDNSPELKPDCQLEASLIYPSSEQVGPVNAATPEPLPLVLPTAVAPLTHASSSTVPFDYTPTTLPPVKNIDNSPKLKPDWLVECNPDIQQTLRIQLAETISCNSGVCGVKFSRSGKYLAVGLLNGETHLHNLKTLSKSVLAEYSVKESVKSFVTSIQFSPDDVYIAIGLSGGRIQIWNVGQKRVRAVLKGHIGPVFSVNFSPNGRFLVSVSWDNTIRIWRTRDGSSKELSDLSYNSVAFSPLGRYIFCGGGCFLRIWDTRSDKLVAKWTGDAGIVRCLTLSKDGKVLVSRGGNNVLKYWDVSSYTGLGVNVEEPPEKEFLRFEVEGHTSYISSIALSSDTRWVFSAGGYDSSMRIWDAKRAALHRSLKGHSEGVMGVDVSPTSQLVASGGKDRCVRLWEYNITK